LSSAEATANQTRPAIRLLLGATTRIVIAVADLDGTIIGLRRIADAAVFSIDVAVTKASNMVYFNSSARTAADLNQVPSGTAVTNHRFGAQPIFTPGDDGSAAGPFFNLYQQDVANPCTQGCQSGPPNANKSGIVFFPGSLCLRRNGVLVGGLGVSSDGVEQDDYVTNAGAANFQAPVQMWADQVLIMECGCPVCCFRAIPPTRIYLRTFGFTSSFCVREK
jgi:uncharacterized protein GlcG (DUF336 family)